MPTTHTRAYSGPRDGTSAPFYWIMTAALAARVYQFPLMMAWSRRVLESEEPARRWKEGPAASNADEKEGQARRGERVTSPRRAHPAPAGTHDPSVKKNSRFFHHCPLLIAVL